MEQYLYIKTTKEIIDGILARHKGKDFFQCLKCGSINSESKDLARTLYAIETEVLGREDESLQDLGESCGDLLRQMIVIGIPEECYGNSDRISKWYKENDYRRVPELDDFEDEVFIKAHNVVLKVDDNCDCNKKVIKD